MKKLLLVILLINSVATYAQQVNLTGSIKDSETNEPIIGANISIKGKMAGTITDAKGNFTFTSTVNVPLTLVVSVIGYQRQEVEVTDAAQQLSISLAPKTEVMDEVVISASRVEESILQSPVSIEKMDGKDIRETASISFYEGLQNIKGVEMVTSGLTYKQINTRGFNDTGNARFLQLVDGVDNQTPGLTFAVGNLFGSSDLDMESAELIPGSASALYGPVAFNGVLMLRTKNPFQYQGLSAQVRTGVNHINEKYADPHGMYDYSIRYAKAFNNRFAFKLNASYFTGLDWYATNYTDVNYNVPENQRGDNNPARNALNIYGDESSRNIDGVGAVSRTGYEERDLMNYNVYSLKLNGALHYRINENMELIYQYNYNQGRAAYTGSSRFQLNDFNFQQHRVELKGGNYFIRAYASIEDSKKSYSSRSLGQLIDKTWVQDFDGNVVSPDQADDMWYDRYEAAFNGEYGVTPNNHAAARAFADQGRFLPGSTEFNEQKDKYIGIQGMQGAGILSQSKLFHVEGQYDFSNKIKVVDVLVGGNFRMYNMFTNGTLFDDKDNPIKIKEGGAFVQVSKKLLEENLRLTASLRYDKNQNFDGHLTPRASAVYTVAKNHNFRTSYQTGFRNPTPGDQYINLNVGPITILGGVPDNSKGLGAYENTFTASSAGVFGPAFGQAMESGTPFPQAIMENKDLLVKSDVPYIKPELVQTFEIGYKGLFANKLLVDVNYYHSSYEDFILNTVVIQPNGGIPVLAPDGTVNPDAAIAVANRDVHAFQLYTNASDRVTAQGATLGLTYLLSKGYTIGANGTWADYNLQGASQDDIPAFNTPKFRTTVTFGNSSITKNLGFNVAWRWQDTFDWYGTFNGLVPGTIKAYSLVDAQVSYRVQPIKSIVKIGGNNIFNNQVYQAYGSPSIGAVYYVSIVFDQFLN